MIKKIQKGQKSILKQWVSTKGPQQASKVATGLFML